ncbi:hypothetical protein GCM10007108_03160 [Thermogymnomonas acidicola]|uniref:Uncharacterized protein n=1 Tax=Thermogymnomonas acidicola TaxID=399579 RepID=A0AA37BQ11_9ARCH|nr:hypothetical protein [Thermogymnomonas acidicola]GGM68427.1 hypothetical protein GCM10007108_03160 [Thermogymnomonas acidicola]
MDDDFGKDLLATCFLNWARTIEIVEGKAREEGGKGEHGGGGPPGRP